MNTYDFLIIGGDAAGMSAASQARRINEKMSIAVIEKNRFVSYSACGMPYYISGDVDDYSKLLAIDPAEFSKKRNIEIFTETEATALDTKSRKVRLKSGDETFSLSFKHLMIATGARAFLPEIDGIGSDSVFSLRSLSDGIKIREHIIRNRPSSAILIGAGFISMEMAETLTKLEIKVTILEKNSRIAASLSPETAAIIRKKLEENHIEIVTGVDISGFIQNGKKIKVITGSGTFEADFAVISTGVLPNTDFVKDSSIILEKNGAVTVNDKSETSVEGIYSGGDCASVFHLISRKNVYMPLGTTANKQGRVAGIQAAGIKTESFPGIIGSQLVKVFDLEIGKTGFNQADADKEKIDAETMSAGWRSRANYYPGVKEINTSLTVEVKTGALIGAEVIGADGAALRTNVAAAAIASGMGIREFAYIDLGYAPPFSPVWDPLHMAAQKFIRR